MTFLEYYRRNTNYSQTESMITGSLIIGMNVREFKWEKDLTEKDLMDLSVEVLKQIEDKSYVREMEDMGIPGVVKIGTVFSGKKVKVVFSILYS